MKENNFLDLEPKKLKSTFGIIACIIAALWLSLVILPGYLRIYPFYNLADLIPIQMAGTAFAIVSLRKKEPKRILYLIGLIINGIGFLYFLLDTIFY